MPNLPTDNIFIITSDAQINMLLERVLKALGYATDVFQDWTSANFQIKENPPSLVILGEKLNDATGLDIARELSFQAPTTPILLLVAQESPEILKQAMRLGISQYLHLPLRVEDILSAVQDSLAQAKRRKEWIELQAKRTTTSLESKVNELETLTRLGRSITSSLDSDSVLSAIIDAAVKLTNSEEGSLLLIDEKIIPESVTL